jgi:hypothetical protein
MKTLYNTILARIQAQVTEIAETDFETGQLESLFGESPVRPNVQFPCALIDIDYPQCSDAEELSTLQNVTARVGIKLAFEVPMPTDSLATETKRNAGLAFLDTVQKVYENMQGYSTTNFNAFSRKSQVCDKRFDGSGIKVYDIVFETSFLDTSAE